LSEVKTDNFVTIFYAILDTTNHKIRYTSAGHCPILLFDRAAKTCSPIKADGLFMGVFPDMMLSESQMSYIPGNIRLILYTDGLIEAKNKSEEMYGVERLTKCCFNTLDVPPEQAVDLILFDQKNFSGDTTAPDDDITILVIDL
jgi:sigma-B regulation protein RsbU (phosphoserine phosphatase)